MCNSQLMLWCVKCTCVTLSVDVRVYLCVRQCGQVEKCNVQCGWKFTACTNSTPDVLYVA